MTHGDRRITEARDASVGMAFDRGYRLALQHVDEQARAAVGGPPPTAITVTMLAFITGITARLRELVTP